MKDIYIRDAASVENKSVSTHFLVTGKQLRPKKSGEQYLDLVLADSTGQLPAKMWDLATEAAELFDVDDVIKVHGTFSKFNGRWQFTVRRMEGKIAEQDIDYGDFLAKTSQNIDAMWSELQGLVSGMKNDWLRRLLQAFFADETIARSYQLAPAAKSLHHACIGGLLEHVMSLCHGALALAPNYPEVDAELLLTGVMLHDIGKIRELNYARSFSYSTEGQLLGHIIIELELLRDKCRDVEGFPAELRMLIEHMMISHHGHYEFGSPKLPMFAEALLLHYLDDMDSKMAAMRSQVARDAEMDSVWTSYNPALSRTVLNVQKYLKK